MFRTSFARFLGVDDADEEDRLVRLWGLRFDDDEVVIVPSKEQSSAIAFTLPNENHDWVFAIHLKLNNEDFVAQCFIHLGKDKILLRVADRPNTFSINKDDQTTYEPALEALFDHLEKWLRWRPGAGGPTPYRDSF